MNPKARTPLVLLIALAIGACWHTTEHNEEKEQEITNSIVATGLNKNDKYYYGNQAYDRGDFALAASWWRGAAELGHLEAQRDLNRLEGTGLTPQQKYDYGIQAYHKGGFKEAQYTGGEKPPSKGTQRQKW